jgi:ribosome-binding protein aMBF1 (putative translation factor)
MKRTKAAGTRAAGRKVAARQTVKGLEMVRYEGDPPHHWHRVTPLSAAERARYQKIADGFEAELREQGLLPPVNPVLNQLGKRIRDSRRASGLSLARLADLSGVEKAALSRLESGKNPNPSLRTLEKVATALGTELQVTFTSRKAAS